MSLPLHHHKSFITGLLAGTVIFVLASLTTGVLYYLNNNLQFDLLREEMANIARISALEVDVEQHKKLNQSEHTNNALYQTQIAPLVKIHNAVPDILYLYTMREIDGKLYYILDTVNDKNLNRRTGMDISLVMEEYKFDPEGNTFPDWLPTLHQGKIHVDDTFYFDDNAYILSASVPLFDEDGKFFGLLGVDFDVSLFEQKQQLILNIVYVVVFLSLILAFIIGWRVYVTSANLEITHAELYKQAHTDFLTGAYNRRHFIDQVKYEMARNSRYKHALSLLLIDIDHFKKVNDNHGHLSGDGVLSMLVRKAKETMRTNDLIARFGGEEFMILLPETPSSGAMIFAERFRELISRYELKSTSGEKFNITISIGISEYNAVNDIDAWLQEADEALYKAKNLGRNQSISYQQMSIEGNE